jgi:hypothetical protein
MVYTLRVNLKYHGYPPKNYLELKFKASNSQQYKYTSVCNVNHKNYMTTQSGARQKNLA